MLVQPGGILHGTVRDQEGGLIPGATVALVPDPPYRGAGFRYRSVIADYKGEFDISGIAPGPYKLFAWAELEGFAYRNAEIMTGSEGQARKLVNLRGSNGSDGAY